PVSLVNGAAVLSRQGRSELVLDGALAGDTSNGGGGGVLPAGGSGVARGERLVGGAGGGGEGAAGSSRGPPAGGGRGAGPREGAMSRGRFRGGGRTRRRSRMPGGPLRCACADRWWSWWGSAKIQRRSPRK